jgi:hypothetical protein
MNESATVSFRDVHVSNVADGSPAFQSDTHRNGTVTTRLLAPARDQALTKTRKGGGPRPIGGKRSGAEAVFEATGIR